jgi:hypothetical protein
MEAGPPQCGRGSGVAEQDMIYVCGLQQLGIGVLMHYPLGHKTKLTQPNKIHLHSAIPHTYEKSCNEVREVRSVPRLPTRFDKKDFHL